MTMTPDEVADTNFTAWTAHDWDTLRSILADDATFRGPLGTADSGDECLAGLKGMSQIMTDVKVLHRWSDETDAITWFELHTSMAPPAPTANWSHVENGKITAIRVTFDPRALTRT